MLYHIVNQDSKKVAKFTANKRQEMFNKFNKRAKQLLGSEAKAVIKNDAIGQMVWANGDTTLELIEAD